MANNQIIISRIQNRRGLKENLPQPLLPGEIALTVDTGELWIGSDQNQPPYGVRTYSSGGGDISTAETIVDTQIVSAKFTAELTQADFDALVEYLIDPGALATEGAPALILFEDDILWDGLSTVFIAAEVTGAMPDNTINNILEAIELEPSTPGSLFDSARSGALGAAYTTNGPYIEADATQLTFATGPDTITRTGGTSFLTQGFAPGQKIVVTGTGLNDGTYTIAAGGVTSTVITVDETLVAEALVAGTLRGRTDPASENAFDAVDGDYQFSNTLETGNAAQGANAAILINRLNGAGLVTTFGNLQITTSGIGVGTPAFRDMTVTDTDSGYTWQNTGTASADSTTDELTFVSGNNINIDVDTVNDAIRITSNADADPDTIYTGFTDTPVGNNVATEAVLSASTAVFTDVPSVIFDIDGDSDVIFLEYSLNSGANVPASDNLTGLGNMRLVASNTTAATNATLVDDQTIIKDDAYTGAIEFQAVRVPASITSSAGSVDFNNNGLSPHTITRGSGSFVADGFTNGMEITVNGSALGNNGVYTIATVAPLTITLSASASLTNETVAATLTNRNQVKIQYINTFTSDVLLRFVARRWMSYDYIPTPIPTSDIMAVSENSGGDGGGNYPLYSFSTTATAWGDPSGTIDDGVLGFVGGRSGLAYSPLHDRWVSVGGSGGLIMTSDDDGATWVERTPGFATVLNRVRWDTVNNQFIAVGRGVETSSDGISWTAATVDPTNSLFNMRDIAYDGTYWLVGSNRFSFPYLGNMKRSTDGISWNTTLDGPEPFCNCMMGIGTRMFFGGTLDVIRYTDNGGTSWTAATGPTSSGNIEGMAHDGAGTIVAVTQTAEAVVSTDNGVSQTVYATGSTGALWDVIYDTELSLFIAVGRNASFESLVTTSPDGINWTERANNTAGDATLNAIASKNQINPFTG